MKLKNDGFDTFNKLGISPIMNVCLIKGANLKVIGGEIEGAKITSQGTVTKWAYGIEERSDGSYQLKNYLTGEELLVCKTDEKVFPKQLINNFEKFDPEKREGLQFKYPPYTLTQIVVPMNNFEIIRIVHRSRYLPWGNDKFLVREAIFMDDKKVSETKVFTQNNIESYPIVNIAEVNDNFENELRKDILFNNEWLKKSDMLPVMPFVKTGKSPARPKGTGTLGTLGTLYNRQ